MGGTVHFNSPGAIRLLFWFLFTMQAFGADFGFSTTIRAGLRTNGDWELGIGPAGNNTSNNAQVNSPNYYPNNLPTRFEMGYTSATNTAFLRYYYNSWQVPASPLNEQATYTTAAAGLGAYSTWTLPRSSFFVSAAGLRVPSGVTVDQLALTGVQVLQPFSTTTLSVNQPGATPPPPGHLTNIGNDVVFRTGATGDWLLSGRIAFSGLQAYVGGQGATRSQLQLLLTANGTSAETPEPISFSMAGLGITAFALIHLKRNRGRRKTW